jgi:putative sterol carrier protein
VVSFLASDWIAAFDAAAQEVAVPKDVRLIVQQVVQRDGGDEVRYYVVAADGRLRVHPGQADSPDVTLTQDYHVAAALSRGELNAQQALAAGGVKLGGDIGRLLLHGAALSALGDAFAALRSETIY